MMSNWRVIGGFFCALLVGSADAAWAVQKTATWNGLGDGVSYNDTNNWDIGEVPINNITDTFIVNIPGGVTVNYDVPFSATTATVDELNMAANARMHFMSTRPFSSNAGSIDSTDIIMDPGASATLRDATYTPNRAGKFIDLDGPTTVLNLAATTTWQMDNLGGTPARTVEVTGGATLTAGMLTTIINTSGDDVLRFDVDGLSSLNLGALNNITGQVAFDVDRALFELNSLASATDGLSFTRVAGSVTNLNSLGTSSGGTWNVPTGGSINAPVLTQLRNTTINFGGGSTLNTAMLVDVQGSTFNNLGPTDTFNFSNLFNVNDARFQLIGGATLAVAATSYRSNGTGTILSADGVGTLLDFSSVTAWTQDNLGGTPNRTVIAQSGGKIDLSNLQSIANTSGDDRLIFQTRSGGTIDLSSLKTVEGPVDFDFDQPNVSLPMLASFNNGTWQVDDNSAFNAVALTDLLNTVVTIGDGGTLNTPGLTNISGSTINLGPNQTFTHGGLTGIDLAKFFLTGGAQLAATATSYHNQSTGTVMSVDGVGSLLDLSTLVTWQVDNLGGTPARTVVAQSGGKIDLSGLQTIANTSGDDDITFRATSQGEIDLSSLQTVDAPNAGGDVIFDIDAEGTLKLGNLTVTRNTIINVNDSTSVLDVAGSLLLDADAVFNIATGGGASIGGNYSFSTTAETSVNTSTGGLRFNGTGTFASPQFLEVGGEDLGVPGVDVGVIPDDLTDPTAIPGVDGNFAIGELSLVGGTVVELRDVIDNGNRSSLEALYLPGLGGDDGLKLLDSSTLVINSINVYAFLDGEWLHLNSLFTGGINAIALSSLVNDPAADGTIRLPEPASMVMLAVGGLVALRRRR